MNEALRWLAPFALPVAVAIFAHWYYGEMGREVSRNSQVHEAPSDHQIRWHIRHIRQDAALACYLLMAIIGLLAYIAFGK